MLTNVGRAARRLLWAALVIVGVATVSFVVAELLPGDPARMMLGPQASAADVAHVREAYGLDRPLPVKYALFWSRLVHRGGPLAVKGRDPEHRSCAALTKGVHLDLGFSFLYRRPVVDVLAAKIPRSLELAVAAVIAQILLGGALGMIAAARRGSALDDAATSLSLLGISTPAFVVGLLLQYVLAYSLRILPLDGYGVTASEHLASIVLPALTLGVFGAALYARLLREQLTSLLEQPFGRTARAKGASRLRVLVVHALRNALAPVMTLAALELGALAGGAVVVERLFRWPGVGLMTVDALLNRDAPVVLGSVLFTSSAVVVATLVLDLAHAALDPRRAARERR